MTAKRSTATAWARFRFTVVGSLLSSPPPRGELRAALEALAAKTCTARRLPPRPIWPNCPNGSSLLRRTILRPN